MSSRTKLTINKRPVEGWRYWLALPFVYLVMGVALLVMMLAVVIFTPIAILFGRKQ